jgi:hypothetical protein
VRLPAAFVIETIDPLSPSMFLVAGNLTPESPNRMTPDRINARAAEPRWQKVWEERGIYATANDPPSRQCASADELAA